MEARARFTVDLDHCQRAEDELYDILKRQELGFATRWNESRASRVTMKVSIVTGLLLSLLGLVVVGALLFFDTRSWSSQPHPLWLGVFAAFAALFAFMPKITQRIRAWSLRAADRRARRNAARGVRDARRLAPYEADYDFKSDVLVYTRGKDGKWQFAWTRPLGAFHSRGLAVQRASVTAVFRKPRALLPSIVILQRDREWTAQILRDAGVTVS